MWSVLASCHEDDASPSPSPNRYPDSEHDSTTGGFVNDLNFLTKNTLFPVLGSCCAKFSRSAPRSHGLVSTDLLLTPKRHIDQLPRFSRFLPSPAMV